MLSAERDHLPKTTEYWWRDQSKFPLDVPVSVVVVGAMPATSRSDKGKIIEKGKHTSLLILDFIDSLRFKDYTEERVAKIRQEIETNPITGGLGMLVFNLTPDQCDEVMRCEYVNKILENESPVKNKRIDLD